MDAPLTAPLARSGERRSGGLSLAFRERRSGFDRRSEGTGRVSRALLELRDSTPGLIVLLASVNVMNVLDQLATTNALRAGFTEGNPVMAALIATDPALAATVKIAAVVAVTATVWMLRRYRAILQAAVVMFVLYAAVLLVHYYGSAFFY